MAIEETHFVAGDDAASDLAHHLFQAGAAADSDKTVRALALAGEVAMRAMAFDDALRHFDNAVALEPEDPQTRAGLLHGRAGALRSLGRWDEALDAWREALSLAEAVGDHVATGQMAWEVAHQLAWATRWQEAAETAARGLATLGDVQTPERAQLTLLCGIAFGMGGNGAFGWQMIEEGTALAERLGDDRLVGYAGYCQAIHHWAYWNADACVVSGRRALGPLRASGDLWDLAALLGFIDFMLFAQGRIDEALPIAREGLELAQRLGHRGAELIPGRTIAYMELFFQGRWDEFEAYVERDIEICRTIESPFIQDAYTWKGMLAHVRGDWRRPAPGTSAAPRTSCRACGRRSIPCSSPAIWPGRATRMRRAGCSSSTGRSSHAHPRGPSRWDRG